MGAVPDLPFNPWNNLPRIYTLSLDDVQAGRSGTRASLIPLTTLSKITPAIDKISRFGGFPTERGSGSRWT